MSRALIVLALVLLIVLYFGGRWFHNTPSHQVAAAIRRGATIFIGVLLVTLAVTGRLHWLFGVIGGMLPLMQRVMTVWRAGKIFRRRSGGAGRGAGQTSTVETRLLRMFLHHSTGALSGVVLEGRFQGRAVEELAHDELMALLDECRSADNDSANVLETYLDRTLGEDWRRRTRQADDNANGAPMSREEAFAILGLAPGASADEIRGAHRRLMQKLHPDRGGSTYLAAKINQAKDLLLA